MMDMALAILTVIE